MPPYTLLLSQFIPARFRLYGNPRDKMFRTTDISQYMASWFSPKKPEMATNNCRIWYTCVRCFIRQTLFPMIVAHTLHVASSTYWRTICVLLPSLTSLGVPFFPDQNYHDVATLRFWVIYLVFVFALFFP